MVQILKSEKEKQEKRREVENIKNKKSMGVGTHTRGRKFVKEGFFAVREGANLDGRGRRSRGSNNNGVTKTISKVGEVLMYSLIGLTLHTVIGYSTASMLTRYSHYLRFETKDSPKKAFLGINGEVDKQTGIVDFSPVYFTKKCSNEGGGDEKKKEDDEEKKDEDDEQENTTVKSMGIQRDGMGHKNSFVPIYTYDTSCDDLNRVTDDGDKKPVRFKKIAAMNMSDLRGFFKELMKNLAYYDDNEYNDAYNSNDDTTGTGNSNAIMKLQTRAPAFVLYPFIMVIGAILTPIIILLTSTFVNGPNSKKGSIISGVLFGFMEGVLDMIVYMLYGLSVILGGHLIKGNVREDFFGKNAGDGVQNTYSNPGFVSYLTSMGFVRSLYVWAMVTILGFGLYVPNGPIEQGVTVGVSLLLFFILSIGPKIWAMLNKKK